MYSKKVQLRFPYWEARKVKKANLEAKEYKEFFRNYRVLSIDEAFASVRAFQHIHYAEMNNGTLVELNVTGNIVAFSFEFKSFYDVDAFACDIRKCI